MGAPVTGVHPFACYFERNPNAARVQSRNLLRAVPQDTCRGEISPLRDEAAEPALSEGRRSESNGVEITQHVHAHILKRASMVRTTDLEAG